MTPTIAKSDEEYDDQEDINSDDNGVYQINQQLEGGMETEAPNPEELYAGVNTCGRKKVSHMAIAFLSYMHMQPAPLEPHPEASRKIKIPQMIKEALQSPEAPHWRQALTVKITQHQKAKTY